MNVEIVLYQSVPGKETKFSEDADEVQYQVDGHVEPIPHTQGNLVGLVSLLDSLYNRARDDILGQMDERTQANVPTVVYVPDDKLAPVIAIVEAQ